MSSAAMSVSRKRRNPTSDLTPSKYMLSSLVVWLVVLASALALLAIPAESALCMPTAVQKDSPYHYVSSMADALGYAKSALDRTASLKQSASSVDLLVAIKMAKGDYECAGSHVAAYVKSSNDTIKSSAEGAYVAFSRLANLSDRTVAEVRRLLDSAGQGEQKQGTIAEQQADLAMAYDEAWKLLLPSVIMSSYAVVEENPKTGLMSGLALTGPQRDEVLRKLRSAFGVEITKGMQAGQLPLTSAAAGLYQVVGDPKRQTR